MVNNGNYEKVRGFYLLRKEVINGKGNSATVKKTERELNAFKGARK